MSQGALQPLAGRSRRCAEGSFISKERVPPAEAGSRDGAGTVSLNQQGSPALGPVADSLQTPEERGSFCGSWAIWHRGPSFPPYAVAVKHLYIVDYCCCAARAGAEPATACRLAMKPQNRETVCVENHPTFGRKPRFSFLTGPKGVDPNNFLHVIKFVARAALSHTVSCATQVHRNPVGSAEH